MQWKPLVELKKKLFRVISCLSPRKSSIFRTSGHGFLINFSPLKHYFKYTNYVYDINEINQKIKDSIKYAPQSNFFKYEQNLEPWIKILKND